MSLPRPSLAMIAGSGPPASQVAADGAACVAAGAACVAAARAACAVAAGAAFVLAMLAASADTAFFAAVDSLRQRGSMSLRRFNSCVVIVAKIAERVGEVAQIAANCLFTTPVCGFNLLALPDAMASFLPEMPDEAAARERLSGVTMLSVLSGGVFD